MAGGTSDRGVQTKSLMATKVICLRNHKRLKWNPADDRREGYLANGEIGLVVGQSGMSRVDATQVEFASQAGESYSFWKKEFAEEASPYLELAYSVTVHKAQGSEFETVILVLPANSRLLTREMLYTALTRQKRCVRILHQGPFAKFHRLQSDFFSETKRRNYHLFTKSEMYEHRSTSPLERRSGGSPKTDPRNFAAVPSSVQSLSSSLPIC